MRTGISKGETTLRSRAVVVTFVGIALLAIAPAFAQPSSLPQATAKGQQNLPGIGPGAPQAQQNLPGIGPGAAAGAPTITTVPPSCVPAGGNALVEATITPTTGWSSVRVYFRRAGTSDFYFLEMRSAGNGKYWAVIPRPEQGTTSVDLQIAVRDADGKEFRGPLQSAAVTTTCTPTLTSEQAKYAQNLVVGETMMGQRDASVFGFLCYGIISRIDAAGAIHSDDYCRKAVIAAAAGAPTTGINPWVPVGILAGVGGSVAIINNRGGKEQSCPCPCQP